MRGLWMAIFCLGFSVLMGQVRSVLEFSPDFGPSVLVASRGNTYSALSPVTLKLAKFNNCSQTIWEVEVQGLSNAVAIDFIQTADLGYAILLQKSNLVSPLRTLVLKLDSNAQVLWCQSYFDVDQVIDFIDYKILENPSGDIIVYGNASNRVNLNVNLRLMALNGLNGQLLWSRFYTPGGIWGTARISPGGGILMRTGNRLIQTDPLGLIVWSKSLNTSGSFFQTLSVSASGIYLCSASSSQQAFVLHRLDLLGNLIWSQSYALIGSPFRLGARFGGNLLLGVDVPLGTALLEINDMGQVVNTGQIGFGVSGLDFVISSWNRRIISGSIPAQGAFVALLDENLETDCAVPGLSLNSTSENYTLSPLPTNVTNVPINQLSETSNVTVTNLNISNLCLGNKNIDLGNDLSFCANEEVYLYNQSLESFERYTWSTGETTDSIKPQTSGLYWVMGSDACGGNVAYDTIRIELWPAPTNDWPQTIERCFAEQLELKAPKCSQCRYLWSTGSTDSVLTQVSAGTYWLQAITSNGCTWTDTVEVIDGVCQNRAYVPSAFKPGLGGQNALFGPIISGQYHDFYFMVYNRWGQLVFESRDARQHWDGYYENMAAPEGIYYWQLQYVPVENAQPKRRQIQFGSLMLMR